MGTWASKGTYKNFTTIVDKRYYLVNNGHNSINIKFARVTLLEEVLEEGTEKHKEVTFNFIQYTSTKLK